MNMIKGLMIVLVFTAILCFVVAMTHPRPYFSPHSPPTAITAPEQQIMSIRELQTALNAQGHSRYKCEIDGRMGKETLKAWSNFICDRQAGKEFQK